MTPENLDEFAAQSADAADETAKAFELAGERIAAALENAARSGELSIRGLAESAAQDLARLAINELFTGHLQAAIGGIGNPAGGSGVSSGKPVTVNMNISGATDAGSIARSKGQISAALARAVASGNKYL